MYSRLKLAVALCLAVGAVSLCAQQDSKLAPAPATSRTLVRVGHLLDVKTGKLADAQTIVVVGAFIQSIAPTASVTAQPGDVVVDLAALTVMPGLIDVHTHLNYDTDFDPYHELIKTEAKQAINGVANARTTLMAGITTVRNVGTDSYADVDLRDAINAGQVPGPHMQVSGPALGNHRRSLRQQPASFRISLCWRRRGRWHRRCSAQGSAEHQIRRRPDQDMRDRRSPVERR